jgi:hypothetical protein
MFDHACYLILENDKALFDGSRKGNEKVNQRSIKNIMVSISKNIL